LTLVDAGACSCPEWFQLDARLIHPLQLSETEKLFLVKSLLVFEHEVDGTTQLVGEDGQSLGFTVFMGKPFEVFLCRIVAFEKEYGCFAECPLRWALPIFLPLDPYFLPFDSLILFINRQ
jgi:hypothetical protein